RPGRGRRHRGRLRLPLHRPARPGGRPGLGGAGRHGVDRGRPQRREPGGSPVNRASMSRTRVAAVRTHLSVPAGVIPRSQPLPWWKRGLDVAVAAAGLLLLAPFFGLVAIAVRLDSAGAAFFGQERLGANGRTFTCWKFRSMYEDAEAQAPMLAARNQANGLIF